MKRPSASELARQAVAMLRDEHSGPRPGDDTSNGMGSVLEFASPPTDQEFFRFQRLIHEEAGIYLPESKRTLLMSRLQRRLRQLGLDSFGAYYRAVTRGGGDELAEMLDCICTNETRFFREPSQFDLLVEQAVPRWRAWAARGQRARRLRAWSAGCSSGEEPYSLAMLLLKHLPASEGWSVEILATDLSRRVLEQARKGLYAAERQDEIPPELLARFTTKAPEGRTRMGAKVRAVVRFEHHNLCGDESDPGGPFDLILCRNVLIYFDAATKTEVVTRVLRRLTPEGLLLLGHSEGPSGSRRGLRSIGPLAYVRAEEEEAWTRAEP